MLWTLPVQTRAKEPAVALWNHRQPFRRLDPRISRFCAVFAHSPISNLALEEPQLTPRDQDRNTGTPIRALHMRNPFSALRLLKTGPPLSSAFGHRNRRVPKGTPMPGRRQLVPFSVCRAGFGHSSVSFRGPSQWFWCPADGGRDTIFGQKKRPLARPLMEVAGVEPASKV